MLRLKSISLLEGFIDVCLDIVCVEFRLSFLVLFEGTHISVHALLLHVDRGLDSVIILLFL